MVKGGHREITFTPDTRLVLCSLSSSSLSSTPWAPGFHAPGEDQEYIQVPSMLCRRNTRSHRSRKRVIKCITRKVQYCDINN